VRVVFLFNLGVRDCLVLLKFLRIIEIGVRVFICLCILNFVVLVVHIYDLVDGLYSVFFGIFWFMLV